MLLTSARADVSSRYVERREYDVMLVPEAEGGFGVFVPDLLSVATQGETVEEALDMARDAIEGYLEIMREEGWPVPAVRRERVAVEAALATGSPPIKPAGDQRELL